MKATMKFNHLHRWIVIFATAVLVAACGFHLRGNYDFPFTSLYIDFPAASQTASILKRQITAMNLTKIVNNPQEAEVILSAIAERKKKEELTYNIQGRVREYSLYYNLEYMVKTSQGKMLIEPTKISLRRTMTYDASEALSKENEEILLYKDMQQDMAQRLLRRLATIKLTAEDRDTDDGQPAATESGNTFE